MNIPPIVARRRWAIATAGALLFFLSFVGEGWVRQNWSPTPDPTTGRTIYLTMYENSYTGYVNDTENLAYTLSATMGIVGFFVTSLAFISVLRPDQWEK
jgi:hypothetical protein